MLPEAVIVGYTTAASPDIWQFVPAPEPRTTRTKPESIAEWKELIYPVEKAELKSRFENEIAPASKLLGNLQSVFAVCPAKQITFFQKFDTGTLVGMPNYTSLAYRFAKWLLEHFPSSWLQHPFETSRSHITPVCFYGFDPKPLLRITGLHAALEGLDVPTGLWYQNEAVLDPYAMLVEAEHRQYLALGSVLTKLGIKRPLDYKTHVDAKLDASTAMEMLTQMRVLTASGHPVYTSPVFDAPIIPPAAESDDDTDDESENAEEQGEAPPPARAPRRNPARRPARGGHNV